MQERGSNGRFGMAIDNSIRNRLELRAELERLLNLKPDDPVKISEVRWVREVSEERPEWAQDILLRFGC